jgi:flagellar basal body P-ring formation protein FlgA
MVREIIFPENIMLIYIIAAAVAATPKAYEDLEALDEMVSLVDASAQPVDARLKLAICPNEPIIAPPVNGAIVVRCAAKGWRLRVPVRSQTQSTTAPQILVRKGELVECIDAGAGFAVSANMVAMDDGALGQPIRVKSPTSKMTITATITARGVVSF